MDWSPFSVKNSGKPYFSVLLLALALSTGSLPVKAQSLDVLPANQTAQSSQKAELAEIQKIAERAIELWAAEDFVQLRPYLSPNLQAVLPVDELKRLWQEQVADVGRIEKIGKSRGVDAINAYLVFVPVDFEQMQGKVIVTVNKQKQIVGVNFPTHKTIEAIAEKSVEAIARGDSIKARENFSPELKAEITPQKLEQKWQRLQKLAGSFKKIVKVEVQKGMNAGDASLVLVTLEFEKVTDDMFFIFNQQKQIVGVDFPVIDE